VPKLHVEMSGSGPPMVALHGWSRSGADFAALSRRLDDRYTVVRPDLRGHGRSPTGPFTLDALVEDLEAVARPFAAERLLLFGWSLGGMVALAALARRHELRQRVKGLVLVAVTPRFTATEGWPHGQPPVALEALARRLRRDGPRTVARFVRDCLAPGEPASALEALGAGPSPDEATAAEGLALLAQVDLRSELAAVTTPTLVLQGTADPICPAGAADALTTALPHARALHLDGAGHLPFLTREADLVDALDGFARGLE
jgi:pimeloyl-[acyl-carrier protein] methyl ester esterase